VEEDPSQLKASIPRTYSQEQAAVVTPDCRTGVHEQMMTRLRVKAARMAMIQRYEPLLDKIGILPRSIESSNGAHSPSGACASADETARV
jgi:hypothetical protein